MKQTILSTVCESNYPQVDFQNEISHFFGIKFTTVRHTDGNIDIYMNQPKDASDLIKNAGLHHPQTSIPQTPYRSGFPVDTIPTTDMSHDEREL